ncbi:LLM class flavin-dependent oxidoreductase [Kineococcus sp. TRM81007]|uniref:LLM class flavin-dependent oxidoreductase n=1 Tax=Kineococcus sp. TRM81007 TaxID=2925831 RepID=UPI001F59FE33|nr:LLM class flavin-dependent oxidoreductase [Kineococcus sp. TRM81007]MCI2239043.1 LLM class flavin-dependent oxidoreductase [Kineococcus sp. TRM81007]
MLPDQAPEDFVRQVRDAEDAGVRTVWTYDHLSWRALRDGPWHATVPLLAAAATATRTVRLGPQVATPNFRHPVPFAKEIMTLDHLSGGRIDLGIGIGAGAQDSDARVLGQAPLSLRERADRFEEWTALLTACFSQERTDHQGTYFTADGARTIPGCLQRPRVPLTLAATGPRGMRLAARYADSWLTYGPYDARPRHEEWLDALERQVRAFDDIRARTAPERRVRRIVQVALDRIDLFASAHAYHRTCEALAAAGFDEISVHWPRVSGQGVPAERLDDVLSAHSLPAPAANQG